MLVIIMKLANDRKILGEWTNGKVFNIIGWTTVTVNAVAVVHMLGTWGHQNRMETNKIASRYYRYYLMDLAPTKYVVEEGIYHV